MRTIHLSLSHILCIGASVLFLSSCSDDDTPAYRDSNLPDIEEGQLDIAGGYNVLMLDCDQIDDFRHPLGTRKSTTVSVDESCPYIFEVVKDNDDAQYLMARLRHDHNPEFIGTKSYMLHLTTTDGAQSKDVRIVVRNLSSPTSVNDYAYNIGKGTDIYADLGNVKYPVLEFDAIAAHLTDNVNNVQQAIHFEIGGERYEETMERMSVSVGLDGSSPTINSKHKFFFTAGGSFGQESLNHSIKNYEYYLGFYGKVMAEVKLNPDWLIPYQADDNLCELLEPTINDALNNPGSPVYQKYPDTQEGIFSLLDHYGAHVITKAAFGGTYIWMYGRKENAYEHSIGHDASAHMSFKGTNGKPATEWVEMYQKIHSSPYISANGVGSDYDYDYEKASDAFERSVVTGGDANTDIVTWESNFSTEKPDKWVIVSYKTLDDDEARMIPLYEFIDDKTSQRYKAIKEYWEAYQDSKYEDPAEDKIVLADFMMKKASSSSHQSGEPKSFVAEGPDGNKYIYFPMMANGNFLYADSDGGFVYREQQGYAAETNQDHFVSADTEACHYWYYALAYDSECNGITDILFDNDDHSGYTRRGDHANDGVSGLIDNNYVYVKTGTSSTPCAEKIKAVGLYNHSNKDKNSDPDKWRIWATSGGAEMKKPFENSESISAFDSYWEPWDNDGHTSTLKVSTDFYIGGLGTANDIRIFYQTKDLPLTKLSFGEGNTSGPIVHPKKWGE